MEPVVQKKKRQEDLLLEAKNFFNAYKKEISSQEIQVKTFRRNYPSNREDQNIR